MSLKRKASFPAIASPGAIAFVAGDISMGDQSPKHLHSRTRKRFRNDRPSDEVVYANTLRWLYSAQRQQPAPSSVDEDMNLEPLPSPETIDPRQQTLLKFFQPAQSTLLSQSNASSHHNHGTTLTDNDLARRHTSGMYSETSSNGSGSVTPSSQRESVDIDMDMDTGSHEMTRDPRKWVGGLGWI